MKGSAAIIGWTLLVAVLAVPSFLFYNWWASNKKNESAAQVQIQSVSTATIFAGAQDKTAAQPPFSQTPTAAEGPIFQSAPAGQSVQSSPAPAVPVPAAVAKQGAGAQSVTHSTAAAQAEKAYSSSASTQTVHGSYFNPNTDRDPTMTPLDYKKIKDEELQRIESERMRQLALRKKQYDNGEGRIKLQGIVGNSVIINGEMYSVGDTVLGIKIIKIGSNYLIGDNKGRKFKKILQ